MAVKNFSWIEKNSIAASAVPISKQNIEWLREKKIEIIITLTENPLTSYVPYFNNLKTEFQLTNIHIPTDDGTGFYNHQYQKIVTTINKYRKKNKKILIHCEGGFGRTTTAILSWWMKEYSKTIDEAFDELKKVRPQILITDHQRKTLIEWQKISKIQT